MAGWRGAGWSLLIAAIAAACTDGPAALETPPAPKGTVDRAPAPGDELEAALCAAAGGASDATLTSLVLALDLPSEADLGYRLGDLVQSTAPTCPAPKADLEVTADEVYTRLAPQLSPGARSLTTEADDEPSGH